MPFHPRCFCGGVNRKLLMGGAAYGTPKKASILKVSPVILN